MPKLDLTRAIRIKGQGGEIAALKGPGFAWARSAAWDASSLPALWLWLDASDASTVTASNTAAVEWRDKSGAGNHAQRLANGPTIEPNRVGGKTALVFDSPADVMRCPTGPIAAPMTLIVVAATGDSTYGRIFNGGFAADSRLFFGTAFGGNLGIFHGPGAGWHFVGNNVPQRSLANPTVIGAVITANQLAPFWNGEALTTIPGAMASTTGFSLGAYFDGIQQNMVGPLCEVIACNAALSTEDRQKAEGYLAHKWGLAASLPANHPYRASAP